MKHKIDGVMEVFWIRFWVKSLGTNKTLGYANGYI